jgi:hypothetical protein
MKLHAKPNPLPCRFCGSLPHLRSRDVHFRPSDDYLFTEIEIECSNPDCSKEHRHFSARATRREALLAWNKRNRGAQSACPLSNPA